MKARLHQLGATLLDAVYPPVCQLCCASIVGGPRKTYLCDTCKERLCHDPHPACMRCAATVGPGIDSTAGCLQCAGHFRFQSAIRLGSYDGKLHDAVLRLKNLTGESLTETLGQLLAERYADKRSNYANHIVVPIPLHFIRRWRRGFNQSAAIGQSLAHMWGIPSHGGVLRRIRSTPLQAGQSATARRENVRGAFRLSRTNSIQGRNILLVDDGMTTGATADEAAKVLLAGGASRVDVAILARR